MAQSQPSPRTSFNSSALVRLLAGLDITEVAASKQTFAERLSQWVAWTDAISLSGALNTDPVDPPTQAKSAGLDAAWAAREEFERVRSELLQAIGNAADLVGQTASLADASAAQGETDFSSHRRHYLAQQQLMDARIGPLRNKLRAALTAVSPTLGKLAALDRVLGQALESRERQLLTTVPVLLREHFAGRHKSSQPPTDIRQTIQSALLAELELRLQPLEGMIEALDSETTKQR